MSIIIIGILFLIIVGSVVYYSIVYGISPMPSSRLAKEVVLQAIPDKVEGTIFELGSGWGTLAFPIAQQHPESQVIAYEISPLPCAVSALINHFRKVPNLEIKREDFFTCSLEEATLVVCYLYPGAMQKLKSKFEKELRPGTIIITNTFAVPGWKPKKVHYLDDIYLTPIYIYVFQQHH